jgi:hypothetical protein
LKRGGVFKKDLAAACRRASVPQIIEQRLSNILRQRQAAFTMIFARPDHNATGAPINVIKPQPGGFQRANAKTRQQHQNRVIAPAGGCAICAGSQHSRDFLV